MHDEERIASILNTYRGEIMAKSPKSLSIWQRNRTVMPAGVGSLFRLVDPFPMVVKRAKGARIWDADDNEYMDCMLGFSTMILGNAPDEVEAAIREALPRGTSYGQCHEYEYAFARLFCDMVPGVEKVTFCNSGTEATMYALRLARATTGRPLVAKFEGGYHGTHDLLAVSFGRPRLNPDEFGPINDPTAIPESPGLSEGAWKDTIVLPFNHPAAFDKIRNHASQLAGVIIEPVQGAAGTIPANREFLSELRRITRKIGAFLIFDEVITGFRLAPGGAQEFFGVIPDVSTFGKIAGGGLPFGAVGGTVEAMRLMEYDTEPGSILMAGTFNGNPLVTAAGTAALFFSIITPLLFIVEFLLGYELIDPMFPKKKSLNVIGKLRKPGTTNVKRLLILSGHHDSALENTWLRFIGYGFYFLSATFVIGSITMVVMNLIQLVGLIIGSVAIVHLGTLGWVLLVYPIAPSIIYVMFLTRGRKNGGNVPGAADNLSASAVAVSMCRFLVKKPLLHPG